MFKRICGCVITNWEKNSESVKVKMAVVTKEDCQIDTDGIYTVDTEKSAICYIYQVQLTFTTAINKTMDKMCQYYLVMNLIINTISQQFPTEISRGTYVSIYVNYF
jgi:hypothetical protein